MPDDSNDPFHAGERAVQELAGERAAAVMNSGVITSAVPPAATGFVASQDLVVLSHENAAGDLRAGIAFAPQGFAAVSDDRRTLSLDVGASPALAAPGAPLAGLAPGDRLGALFIELATRRRLRVNGRIAVIRGGTIDLAVAEAYPACPKYIQRRTVEAAEADDHEAEVTGGDALTEDLCAWIEGADTLFVASGDPGGQLDVSHRGGTPGFVRVRDGALRVPDYPGNSMFNTLGNLTLDPRAGIAVPDFRTGRQLSLTGTVTLDLASDRTSPRDATGGTGRWWSFHPTSWRVVTPLAVVRWGAPDPSPFNPGSRGATS